MVDLTTFFLFLALLNEGGGGGSPFGPSPGPAPGPGPSPGPAPGPPPHVTPFGPPKPGPAPAPVPHVTPFGPPKPFPTPVKPQGLPPFPGPSWTACAPTPAIVARAQYWNPILWNYPTKTIRQATAQEQLGGQWVTFRAAWHPDASGNPKGLMATEAYCLGGVQPPGPGPTPPPGPLTTVAAVGPEPALGAWKNDAAYVKRYQASLSLLSFTKSKPAWNTQGVDGQAGPHTMGAVRAFQVDNGVQPVDGEVGSITSSAIDRMQGFPVPDAGYPVPTA